jgi:chemotaxis signal transduction protein
VSDELIEPVPDLISETGTGYVEGVVSLNDRFITLINLQKALSGEILSELDEVMTILSRQREQPVATSQAS